MGVEGSKAGLRSVGPVSSEGSRRGLEFHREAVGKR